MGVQPPPLHVAGERRPRPRDRQGDGDLWNGFEVGGGSIRIHRPEVQRKVFEVLGLSEVEIEEKFGHSIRAFRYGAPPHGGIAMGSTGSAVMMAAGTRSGTSRRSRRRSPAPTC